MTTSDPTTSIASSPPVAIIGMACLFPKAPGLKAYWRLLWRGGDAIGPVPPTHWSARDYYDPDPKRPDHVYCTRGGYLEPVDFDPTEFGIPPSSLEATDTSQLLSLLTARMALSDAGYGPGQRPFDRQRTSVILGVTGTQELVIPLASRLGHPRWRRAMLEAGIDPATVEKAVAAIGDQYVPWQESSFPGLLGNVVAGRISNRFDLGGTNCAVDAACASSLSALNLALLELWAGRSRMAITGGADLLNDIFMHMCFAKSQILSASGDARPFSRDADGTVLGEGVGLVVLKAVEAAEKDGDRIYAVIRGIGAASDARSSSIYAPRREGQVAALERAYASADVPPQTVELVEAHGTGTRVGDQVEFKALKTVFANGAAAGKTCALGSVKSMIGHAKAAAGAAGLIKAALALHHRVLPPTLKVAAPDPGLEIAESPFYLNTAPRPWTRRPDHPRRAAVSAFGFGGSNFHVVLEEYPGQAEAPAWDHSVFILALAADRRQDLQKALAALRDELGQTPAPAALAAAAHRTCSAFDPAAPWRLTLVLTGEQDAAQTLADAAEALQAPDPAEFPQNVFFGSGPAPGKLAVLFPGQGSQYPRMGRDLVCLFPEARQALETVQEAVAQPPRLAELIYPPADFTPEAAKRDAAALQPTDRAQPAIGALSAGWYRVLARFGLAPDALAGHSFGELTALWAAGRIDLETFARLAALRGKVMAEAGGSGTDPGTMLAVKAPLAQLEALELPQGVILANRNSPRQGVFSGPTAAIAALEKQCRRQKLRGVRLPVAAAFHSSLIAEARRPFARAVQQTPIASGAIPVYGNTDAAPYPSDTDAARAALADQMVRPVDFVGLVNRLYQDGCRTFLEVGPKAVLTGLVGETLAGRTHSAMTVDRSAGRGCGIADLAVTLARLAAMGHRIDLSGWESPPAAETPPRMRVSLTGANHRSPQKNPAPRTLPVAPAAPKAPPADPAPGAKTPDPPDQQTPSSPSSTTMKTPDPRPAGSPDPVAEALKSVQAGLKAIESMQARTTEAHRKFLDVQQEASRTLQQMMTSAERLSQTLAGGGPGAAAPVYPPLPAEAPAPVQAASAVPVPEAVIAPPAPAAEETAPPGDDAAEDVLAALVAVVSELTGYPENMLGAEMDLEADLGIDSIKRVEILSALEERLPGRGSVSAEKMAELKTLGDIAALLGAAAADISPPAAAVPDQAGAPPAPAADAAAPAGEVLSTLVAVVSELTGYPENMLGTEMDLEADLGIDSIKRVEILSALEERLPGRAAVSAEQMAELKTLGDIAAALDGSSSEAAASPPGPGAAAPSPAPPAPPAGAHLSMPQLDALAPRRLVTAVPYAPPTKTAALKLAPQGRLLVAGGDGDLGPLLARCLKEADLDAVHLSTAQIETALAGGDDLPRASGLVMVAGADADPDGPKRAFALTRRLVGELTRAADQGGALLAAVTRLDGALGFLGGPLAAPSSGALAGLVKTAALELEKVACRVIDVGADWADAETAAAAVAKALAGTGPADPVEIGVTPGGWYRLELAPAPYREGRLDLAPGAVVVATGGARGVTAEALLALAREVKPACLILGRSPLPGPAPDWMAGLHAPTEIRQALLKTEFAGRKVGPRQLAERAAQLSAEAEVRRNLERLQAAGATVIYHPVDVRRRDEVARAIEAVRTAHGPISVLIHGAGTLADRRIEDKTDAQFDRVFDTKVRGLENLLAATADDPLGYVVVFSSVAARFGNVGQADYAMANEWLNKKAADLARRRPETRVLAINWGPWDGGMVDEGLKRHFAARGVSLLDPAAGAAAMVRAMADPAATEVEMVVGGDLEAKVPACDTACVAVADNLELALAQEVDLERFPVLADHMLGGRPVVPLALMIEWLGHTALHTHPGLTLVGLDDLRVLSGIKLDGKPHPVKLMSGPSVRRDGLFEVPVALFNGNGHNGSGPVHSRARALLADAFLTAPAAPPPPAGLKPFPLSPSEAYGRVLFHGERLHGIQRIVGCSDQGMVARLAPAPNPERWVRQPLRSRWITDPLVLDAAFQMAILWSHVQLGMVSLPACAESYRQYRRRFPAEGVTAEMRVVAATSHRLKADIAFLDAQRQVVAILSGYEATMDPGLEAAFKARAA